MEGLTVIGMTMVIVARGFDLSVGSMLGFSGVIVALLLHANYGIFLSILLTLFAGFFIGLTNGLIITKIKVNPLITTLGMMTILRGGTLVLTEGSITQFPESFTRWGQGAFFMDKPYELPYQIFIMVIFFIIGDILLRRTKFLRQLYYVGGNEKVSLLSGINVDRIRMFTYIITSILASFAGILTTSRFNGASISAGVGTELKVIAAVIIGGGSLSGGEGTILGGILGLALVAFISAGLIAWGIDPDWEGVISGAILIIAVAFDRLVKRKSLS